MQIDFSLMPYQEDFVFDAASPIVGLAAGKGAGKSWAAMNKAIYLSAIHRGCEGIIASPTFGMTRRNLVPMLKRLQEENGLDIKGMERTNAPNQIRVNWGGVESVIHLDITIENFGRMNGTSPAWLIADEIDMARREDAELFIEEAIFRCRWPAPGQTSQVNLMGAPELNGVLGEYFGEKLTAEKQLYRWSMMQNYLLSDSYKERIKALIPLSKQAAWINGEFSYNVDGLVYDDFDPTENHTELTVQDVQETERVHVCWDINDGGTSVIIGVRRGAHFFVLDEWMAMKDTAAVIKKVKMQHWGDRAVLSCDPSCTQVFSYIHGSGLQHRIMNSAPEIEWRVTAVNSRFGTKSSYDGKIQRHLLINTKKCKVLTKCLGRQGYVKGEPDKKTWIEEAKTDISGPLDALGYLIYREWPYNPRKQVQQVLLRS